MSQDSFKILIATDNHIGYMEKDPERHDDSFKSFEEILKIAVDKKVDFIILGGDLFHDNKPSRMAIHKTMVLLRQYCLGDKPCPIEFLSDQSENFPDRFARVNYMDPNLNVAIPVFSIHGNHDEPTGKENLCALDILSAAGLVNYWGRQVDLNNVEIKPLLMRKGKTRLALYGLGNIRDDRLNRIFEQKKVTMFRPSENTEEWFNLLVLHQNRVAHSIKNYLPIQYLDNVGEFLHLCLWGHEHECLINPVQEGRSGIHITQPGSSIATSLCEGEAVEKHVGILTIVYDEEILEPKFSISKIPLKTVRPFVMEDIVLKEINRDFDKDTPAEVIAGPIYAKLDELIEKAKSKWRDANPQSPISSCPKPLIRLRVDFTCEGGGFKTYTPQKYGMQYTDIVANPSDLVYFHRKKAAKNLKKKKESVDDVEALLPQGTDFMVETLVLEMLKKANLKFMPENELADKVLDFVLKQDNTLIDQYVQESIENTRKLLGEQLHLHADDDSKLENDLMEIKNNRAGAYSLNHAERTFTPGMAPIPVLPDEIPDDRENFTLPKKVLPKLAKGEKREKEAEDQFVDKKVYKLPNVAKKGKKVETVTRNPAGRSKRDIDESEEDEDEDVKMEDDQEEEEIIKTSRKTSRPSTIADDSDDEISVQSKSTAQSSAPASKVIRRSRAPAAAKPAASRILSQTNSSIRNARATIDEEDDDIIEIDEVPSKPPKRAIKTSAAGAKKQPRQSTLNFSSSLSK